MDEFILDILPDDARHFVAIELDDGVLDLDLLEGGRGGRHSSAGLGLLLESWEGLTGEGGGVGGAECGTEAARQRGECCVHGGRWGWRWLCWIGMEGGFGRSGLLEEGSVWQIGGAR